MFLIIPIGHDHAIRRYPYVTIALMALCVAVGLTQLISGPEMILRFGYVPADGPSIALLTSAFLHVDIFHLLGNLLFLWLVGCNLEDRWGHAVFGGLYVAGAVVSAFFFGIVHRDLDLPLIGASGAVSTAIGAFLLVAPRARIKFWWAFIPFRTGTFRLPAYVVIPFWFLEDLVCSVSGMDTATGVAYVAHVAGMVLGFVVAALLRFTGAEKRLLPEWEQDSFETDVPTTAAATGGLAMAGAPGAIPPISTSRPSVRVPQSRPPPPLSQPPARPLSQPPPRPLSRPPSQPPDAGDAERLLDLALAQRDTEAVRHAASQLVHAHSAAGRDADVLDVFERVASFMEPPPLDDRAYMRVARAARASPALIVRAVGGLLTAHPESPLVPRALWEAADAQHRAGRPDLCKKTLQRLVAEHPFDPFADQARQRLGGRD